MADFNVPIEQGKEYEVTIDAVGRQGDGIAHVQGLVIFVKGAKMGDKIKIRITAVRERSAQAEIVQ
jgi:predicted RNA-binding protein with TRAM domain